MTFNLTGLNVILGTIHDPKNLDSDSHNLGKSRLIEVIDYILLKGVNDKNKFFLTKGEFIGQIFYGEIWLNDGRFLVVKRGVDNPSKISFKINEKRLESYEMNLVWDEEEVPINKAKQDINELFGFTILHRWPYRKSVNYFLRHQNDYSDLFKLNKFRGKDKDWKPFIFDLLGFDGNVVLSKYEMEEEKATLVNKIKVLESEADIQIDEKDKILGLIEIKNEEKNQIEKLIDKFDFRAQEEETNDNLVVNVDEQLKDLHSQRYYLASENNNIKKSLNNEKLTIDIKKLEELFHEIKIIFPNQVIDDLNALIDFNKQITDERNEILKSQFSENEKYLEEINSQINILNDEKVANLNYLTEYDTYKKFKVHQKQLSNLEAEIIYLEKKYKIIDESSKIVEKIDSLEAEINKKIKSTHDEIGKQKHKEIRKIFNGILKEILSANAILSIRQNREGNVEFNANIQKPDDLTITEEDFGTSYKKLMCIAFDLSLLINYSDESFYRFAYHDGALEALDDRKKIKFLNLSRRVCNENNLQHIITLIDSDIPRDFSNEIVPFHEGEVILYLNDKDVTGVLFEKFF